MKNLKLTVFSALTTLAMTLAVTCVHAAGFQHGFAADPNGKPLESWKASVVKWERREPKR